MLIYITLVKLLPTEWNGDNSKFWILIAVLLYAAHPIHTEVVANIKGRDEIMSMMGSMGALFFALKYTNTKKVGSLVLTGLSLFLGLMSKENAITFLAIIPLSIFMFRDVKIKKLFPAISILLGSAVIFLIIRSQILGWDFGGTPKELMNNPFLKIVDNQYVAFSFGEKYATILYTLGWYLKLLIFPHPLTHDYYPRHVEMMSFSDPLVLVSLIIHIVAVVFAIKWWRTKRILSYSILFYLITLSIVSNIIFPIGTNMSERFLFMPSLGFTLFFVFGAKWLTKNYSNKILTYIFGFIIVLFSFKTFTRNTVWKDDFTLFTTDVKTSKNSAKVLNAAGGALVNESYKVKDKAVKAKYLDDAIKYLMRALEIHPNYKNAVLILGNAYYNKKDYKNAINAYDHALKLDPTYESAEKNLAITLRDAARVEGEQNNDLQKAQSYLRRSISLFDQDPESYRLLGITFGIMGNHERAIENFKKVVELDPDNAGGYVILGKAYQNYGNSELAKINFQKAVQIDPKALENN